MEQLHQDCWEIVYMYLPFQDLVNVCSDETILWKAYDPRHHTWMWAAWWGYLGVVKWLSQTNPPGNFCTQDAVDYAAGSGQLEMIQYIHRQTPHQLCTSDGVWQAIQIGRLDILRYLYTHAMASSHWFNIDDAARLGHSEIVQWIHTTLGDTAQCTTNAMDYAAWCGHFNILKFLHSNRREGCTVRAMDWAAKNGHLEIIQWLHETRTEGCTSVASVGAAKIGRLDILWYLHTHHVLECTRGTFLAARRYGHQDVVAFLEEYYYDSFHIL
jgi:hypothetical protein